MTQDELSTEFYIKHGQLLCSSYSHWTGKQLLPVQQNDNDFILALYEAPFVVVSHGIEDNPIFNFGNKTALELFELDWDQFIQLPSRNSVETTNRKQREELMRRVSNDGHMIDYSGVRVSSTGKRFKIKGATIWNIIDDDGQYYGQAAIFKNWTTI